MFLPSTLANAQTSRSRQNNIRYSVVFRNLEVKIKENTAGAKIFILKDLASCEKEAG